MRAMPAAFQNTELASSATPTKAPPIAAARAPTAILRNCPSKVPTFSKMLAAPAIPGVRIPIRPRTATVVLTFFLLRSPRLANDHEPATLLALRPRLDREQVDPAHDILAVSRYQVPACLAVVRIVLLTVETRSCLVVLARYRRPYRLIDLVRRFQHRHQVSRHRVDADRPLPPGQAHEIDVRSGRVRGVGRQIPRRGPLRQPPEALVRIGHHPYAPTGFRGRLGRHALRFHRRAPPAQLGRHAQIGHRVERGDRVEIDEPVLDLAVDVLVAPDRIVTLPDHAVGARLIENAAFRGLAAVRDSGHRDATEGEIGLDDLAALFVPEVPPIQADGYRVALHGRPRARIEPRVVGHPHARAFFLTVERVDRVVPLDTLVIEQPELAEQLPLALARARGSHRTLPIRHLPDPVPTEVEPLGLGIRRGLREIVPSQGDLAVPGRRHRPIRIVAVVVPGRHVRIGIRRGRGGV